MVRALMGESLGSCSMILGPLIAIAAICGIWQCFSCRIRDCGCCKRLFRATGIDPYDDFEMMILVHQVTFTSTSKVSTYVKVRAGEHVVHTDPDADGVFQQALCVFIEQGTDVVKFELVNTSDNVLAELKLDVMKDIRKDEDGIPGPDRVIEKTFVMKQKNKYVLNPRIKLTFSPEGPGDAEKALLSGLNASTETEWMLQQQLAKAAGPNAPLPGEQMSEMSLLARGCFGPLEMFGSFGNKSAVYVGVLGPPRRKRFALNLWESERDYREDRVPIECIDLLRISAVTPDPGRHEVFLVSYVDKDKSQQKATFNRIDRGRDVWVEMLQILVTKVHDDYTEKKDKKPKH